MLSTIRSAEAAFYAENESYGVFSDLAEQGFLDSRFRTAARTPHGPYPGVSLEYLGEKALSLCQFLRPDGQMHFCRAKYADGPILFLDESGMILDFDSYKQDSYKARTEAEAALSTVRSAQAAFYAQNGHYCRTIIMLAKSGFLPSDWPANPGFKLSSTLDVSESPQSYWCRAYVFDGSVLSLTESGQIETLLF